MRTPLKQLLKGKMLGFDRYIYHDLSIEDYIKEQVKLVHSYKQKGIPFRDANELVLLKLFEAEITIDKKYRHPIYKIESELSQVRTELQNVRAQYDAYVEAERKGLPDKSFDAIDMIEAKLKRLKSQSEEQQKYNSQSND